MKKLVSFLLLIVSTNCFSSEGAFNWLGGIAHRFHLPIHVLTFLLIAIILITISILYRMELSKAGDTVIPARGPSVRAFVEAYGTFMYNQCKTTLGEKQAAKYFPFLSMLFILILFSNAIGMIPGFLPPTEHLSTTLALGVLAFIYYNVKGIKEVGIVNYIKHFMGPLWYMAILIFPIEIIGNLFRPMTLAMRLRGNMFADHLVVGIFSSLVPILLPIVFMLLGTLVIFIQAYVFTLLTMVYISLATAHHDHEEAHH